MISKKVLIVDDDRDLVRSLQIRCETLGLDVNTSYDGMEAAFELMAVNDSPPDLIILDVNMPIENGLSLCQMFSEDTLLARIPVIILTGRRDEETLQQCRDLGVHYVCKGADTWDRLRPLITELLGIANVQLCT